MGNGADGAIITGHFMFVCCWNQRKNCRHQSVQRNEKFYGKEDSYLHPAIDATNTTLDKSNICIPSFHYS